MVDGNIAVIAKIRNLAAKDFLKGLGRMADIGLNAAMDFKEDAR
jgi:hypothetical protein